MVRAHGLVTEDKIRDARAYKQEYLDRLIKRVLVRLEKLESGALSPEEVSVHGVHDFIERLAAKGTALYVFSGTDRDDVRNEADKVGVARHFQEIWGALDDVEAYSKEKVIREIIAQHELHGKEVMAVGDGPVEIQNVKACGGIGIGVASDEVKGYGINETKRDRLIRAGADIIIGDFLEGDALLAYLFNGTSGN
jgi:phosphoglycolate phosphatase-like HAD superfamily hydrolase